MFLWKSKAFDHILKTRRFQQHCDETKARICLQRDSRRRGKTCKKPVTKSLVNNVLRWPGMNTYIWVNVVLRQRQKPSFNVQNTVLSNVLEPQDANAKTSFALNTSTELLKTQTCEAFHAWLDMSYPCISTCCHCGYNCHWANA